MGTPTSPGVPLSSRSEPWDKGPQDDILEVKKKKKGLYYHLTSKYFFGATLKRGVPKKKKEVLPNTFDQNTSQPIVLLNVGALIYYFPTSS